MAFLMLVSVVASGTTPGTTDDTTDAVTDAVTDAATDAATDAPTTEAVMNLNNDLPLDGVGTYVRSQGRTFIPPPLDRTGKGVL